MKFEASRTFALECDKNDTLNHFKERFLFPKHNGKNVLYFTGNSLGLQPASAKDFINQELNDWEKFGVEGHFEAKNPWYSYHEMFAKPLAMITGAKENEVAAMGSLTNNLHLLMVSFYRPSGKRTKIISEKKAFPSDIYALKSQIRFHGLNPDIELIEIAPRSGEYLIQEEDILDAIEKIGDELAMVMIGGVNYFTGQLFNMKRIAEATHKVGAISGFDLAHAAGNVPLNLHEWQVDFAAWCSYKYMNSGPGGVSGIFVHEKHLNDPQIPRFEGWWGTNTATRFLMKDDFEPMNSAGAWQLSNAPVFSMAIHKASLNIFEEAGLDKLRAKSIQLTAYLEFLINRLNVEKGAELIQIISPKNPDERGCQLSLVFPGKDKSFHTELTNQGIVSDWREPNVIRVAPVPLYNTFEDVIEFYEIVKNLIS